MKVKQYEEVPKINSKYNFTLRNIQQRKTVSLYEEVQCLYYSFAFVSLSLPLILILCTSSFMCIACEKIYQHNIKIMNLVSSCITCMLRLNNGPFIVTKECYLFDNNVPRQ